MERFEASESCARTGTGSRREGEQFEGLVQDWWHALADSLVQSGAERTAVITPAGQSYARLRVDRRSLYLPDGRSGRLDSLSRIEPGDSRAAWFDRVFHVTDLVKAYPGEAEAIERYSPPSGPFAGDGYPQMYSGMTTKFDGTLVLEQDDTLKEKVLLEYKTAKSSEGRQIDGNAHERLSFQILQYLEAATRFTRCSLAVFANGAFVRYRNKYHVNFHVQADRLANFAWFHLEHLCTEYEYLDHALRLVNWLVASTDSTRSRRD